MEDLAEKRVFSARAGAVTAYVACDLGVVAVPVAGDRVGGAGVVRRCDAVDVAAAPGRLAVATDGDVLVGRPPDGGGTVALEGTGFGPAAAVGVDGDAVLAADPAGRVSRLANGEWLELGAATGPVHAIDGPLVATDDGVLRAGEADLANVGLAAVRDVAAAGVPYAATATGLYRLGNGWMDVLDGDFRLVAAAAGADAGADRVQAATAAALHERRDGGWRRAEIDREGPLADLGYAHDALAIAPDGRLWLRGDAGWRPFELGLDGVVALATA